MSLRKVSDLPPITDEQLESNDFDSAIIEMSYPVNKAAGIVSYLSQYIRNSLYYNYLKHAISSFNHNVDFYSGITMSGDLSCNASNPYNSYKAYLNFGGGIELHSNELSIFDDNGHLLATFGYPYSTIYSSLSATLPNNIINVLTPAIDDRNPNLAVNKEYVKNYVNGKLDQELAKIKFGMFASCDYAIVSLLPDKQHLKPNTFYFILES